MRCFLLNRWVCRGFIAAVIASWVAYDAGAIKGRCIPLKLTGAFVVFKIAKKIAKRRCGSGCHAG